MTKIESLEKSLEMWTWIRDRAREGQIRRKREYLEKIKKEKFLPEADCYLCEYKCLTNKQKCGGCPISSWANSPSSRDYEILTVPCTEASSPFYRWSRGKATNNLNDVLEGATSMVFLLENELRKS